jgi:hypothetical protein
MKFPSHEPADHRAPSVGAIIKKCLAINPRLSAPELIEIIRRSARPLGERSGEFAEVETVDETHALELARASVTK